MERGALPKHAETRQTVAPFNGANLWEASLTHVTHSKMLETRRRRERAKKDSAGAAKRAKNLAKRSAKKARAGAAKPA